MMKRFYAVMALLLMLTPGVLHAADAPAVISPDAAAVLEKLSKAYADLKSLDLTGKLSGEFDVEGDAKNENAEFTSSFAAPNKFRHELKDDSVVGSTGAKLFIHNKARNIYLTSDAPAKKVMSEELPDPFADVLGSQNLSLLLAMSSDPTKELTRPYTKIDKAADVTVDGKTYTALAMSNPAGRPSTTVLIDPSTSLLRRATMDVASEIAARRGAPVKKAIVTVDYTTSAVNAPAKDEQFAWNPPAGAKDLAEVQQDSGGEASVLEGKPAPAFKLKDLEDKDVALADFKGQVVVLDFWATWCGPCVEALPHLDKLYQDKKATVKIFAVNQGEEKEPVAAFMKSKNLTVPVLLDSDSKVGNEYKAQAIPQTVVIGKDGVVKKVFVGSGPNTAEQIKAAVESAEKAAK